MPYRVFLVVSHEKELWFAYIILYLLPSSFRFLIKHIQNKSLFQNVKRKYYFLIGSSHLEVLYKMRLLNSSAKPFSFFFFFKSGLQLTYTWNIFKVTQTGKALANKTPTISKSMIPVHIWLVGTWNQPFIIVGRGVLTHSILWKPSPSILSTPPSFFKFCPTPFPAASNSQPHCLFCCLVPLAEWVIAPHLMCYFT